VSETDGIPTHATNYERQKNSAHYICTTHPCTCPHCNRISYQALPICALKPNSPALKRCPFLNSCSISGFIKVHRGKNNQIITLLYQGTFTPDDGFIEKGLCFSLDGIRSARRLKQLQVKATPFCLDGLDLPCVTDSSMLHIM
jgi:hypothetical protein